MKTKVPETVWREIDCLIDVATAFILSDEEFEETKNAEQLAYDSNLPTIRQILGSHEAELKKRGFRPKLVISSKGLRFSYCYPGFYGPGGFTSQFHVAGPLVVATIAPEGASTSSGFYSNDLDKNIFLGRTFDELVFRDFILQNLLDYLQPENQILSLADYEFVRAAAKQS